MIMLQKLVLLIVNIVSQGKSLGTFGLGQTTVFPECFDLGAAFQQLGLSNLRAG